jgi:hypothetical protein
MKWAFSMHNEVDARVNEGHKKGIIYEGQGTQAYKRVTTIYLVLQIFFHRKRK